MGGCLAHGLSYEMRGFPMLVVFRNKEVQVGGGMELGEGGGQSLRGRVGAEGLNPRLLLCNYVFIDDFFLGCVNGCEYGCKGSG